MHDLAAEADFIVMDDRDFAALDSGSYKPKSIKPHEFIRLHLSSE